MHIGLLPLLLFFGSMVDGNTTKADVMGIYLDFLNGNPVPNISALQTELDFGLQFAGYPESEWINLINTGIENLEITEIVIEGEVYSYYGPSIIELEPMEMVNLEIIQAASITGLYEGTLTIVSNDPDTPDFEILLSGACVQPPIINVEPGNIEVSLIAGDTYDEIITISNTGGYDLGFSAVLEEGSRDVSWLEMDHHFNLLGPGIEDEIVLTFNTEFLEEDQYNAEIVIYHDDPGQDEIIIPVTLYMSYVNAANNLIGSQVTLSQNFPNPFNPSTTISFTASDVSSSTTLSIYNVKGELVKTLVNDVLTVGTHSVIWNGMDGNGKSQPSGMYFYRLQNADKSITRKMILMK
jgi:flagellar hook capping protein FlgD